jgi:acetyltransferase-like isoleucine patch superfamily enzyme
MNKFLTLYKKCKEGKVSFVIVLVRYIYFFIFRKNILAYSNCTINGLKNITTNGILQVGISPNSFMMNSDKTLLEIEGKLNIVGNTYIGKGCRLDIGKNAIVNLNKVFINANCLFVIKNGLDIGKSSIVSWNCQFIDEDFHNIMYENKTEKEKKIVIGEHVWIGANCVIMKGVSIADGCVIAANSVVTRSVEEKNILLAGHPAKIIKREIEWKI